MSEAVFQPGEGPIRIKKAAIENRKASETDLSNIDTTHPFDQLAFVRFINKEFPKQSKQLNRAVRPQKSEHPDELEEWEAARILRRKARFPHESDVNYLSRLLYEETFSVNQQPGDPRPPMRQGMPGMTPGGLLSHFYFHGSVGPHTIEAALALHLNEDTFEAALTRMNSEDRLCLVDVVHECTNPAGSGGRRNHMIVPRLVEDPTLAQSSRLQDMDSIGYRLLRMLQAAPEFMTDIHDPQLKSVVGSSTDKKLSKVEFLDRLWAKMSRALLDEQGVFKLGDTPGIKETLRNFLFVRTHPEMQVFYKFLSPSGYINTAREEKK